MRMELRIFRLQVHRVAERRTAHGHRGAAPRRGARGRALSVSDLRWRDDADQRSRSERTVRGRAMKRRWRLWITARIVVALACVGSAAIAREAEERSGGDTT